MRLVPSPVPSGMAAPSPLSTGKACRRRQIKDAADGSGQTRQGHAHPARPRPAQGQVRAPGTHRGTGRRVAGMQGPVHGATDRPRQPRLPGNGQGSPLVPIQCAADAWPCRRTAARILPPAGPRLPGPPTPAPVASETTGAVSNPWGPGSTGLISVPGSRGREGEAKPQSASWGERRTTRSAGPPVAVTGGGSGPGRGCRRTRAQA